MSEEGTVPKPPPPAVDAENQTSGATISVSGIVRRWRRDDLIKKGSLILRGVALVFSLLSFIIMACNNHGDWRDFDKYEEYRYLLAIAILSTLYTGLQEWRHFHQISTGKMFERKTSAMVDFFGDQIVAYLLISSASAAVPLTNRMREGQDNIFTDSSASAISMSFFAFFCLGLSAMVSGYKLSSQSYI